jgi:hypothetical protein
LTNRFLGYWQNDDRPLPPSLEPDKLTAEEVLFLILHTRERLIARISESSNHVAWIETISAGFSSLLHHTDMEDHHRIYHGRSPWHDEVRPPSVIASQLLMFLGRLSVTNGIVYEGCLRRGSVQGFMHLTQDLHQWRELGASDQEQ